MNADRFRSPLSPAFDAASLQRVADSRAVAAPGNRAAKRALRAAFSRAALTASQRTDRRNDKMSAMDLDQPGAGWASGPQFDPDLLRLYYARLFPYDQWCKWMAYNSDEPGTGSQLARRELSLTLADDVYIRYQCFTNAKEMKTLMTKRQPHKIDIGAVFNCVPRDHLSVKNFRPESRELVFDIDLSDYDDVRTCCQVGDAAWKMNLNLTWSRRWRQRDVTPPRRRRRGRQRVHASRETVFVPRRARRSAGSAGST